MERCSYFIKDKALFGSFPNQDTVEYLESIGVRYFIDLTEYNEHKTTPYITKYNYVKYPILDRKIPEKWCSFAKLIISISKIIRNLDKNEKIYIHCKGGHGRSGIVVASILCYYYNISAEESIRKTGKFHQDRKEMKEKWRTLGSPQGKKQKDFIYKFFKPLRYSNHTSDYNFDLNNNSDYPVEILNVGTFPNAYFALQYFKCPTNIEYIEKLKKGILCEVPTAKDWEEKKIQYMYEVLKLKFNQHPNIKNKLLNTGLRPLIKVSLDTFWGDGMNGQGKNTHGKILYKLRKEFLDSISNDYFLPQQDNL